MISPLTFQSTHLVWGATGAYYPNLLIFVVFQSTHLVWGATAGHYFLNAKATISIHAPRVRCDEFTIATAPQRFAISIHAPRVRCDGGLLSKRICRGDFNPRTSCEVRLDRDLARGLKLKISIHAPRVRCDPCTGRKFCVNCNFNPRTSCEVRHSFSPMGK